MKILKTLFLHILVAMIFVTFVGCQSREERINKLIQQLKEGSWEVRRKAAEALDKLGWKPKDDSEKAVYFIAKWEWDECVKLGKIAVEPLIKALKDENEGVRYGAAEALVKIGKIAVEPLINALKDESLLVREGAAIALGKIGDSRAVEPLINALKDENGYVREKAAQALGKIGDSRAVEPLINALKDESLLVREGAAIALGKIGDSRAVEPLINALRDESWIVRKEAAEVLGKIGDSRAVEPLIKALRDEDEGVRERAAEALGKLGKIAVEPLIKALKNESKWVRWGAAEALGNIGDSRAVEPLISTLQDWYAGSTAAEALDKLGWKPESIKDKVHYFVAKRDGYNLEKIWAQTKKVLLEDVESNKYRIIENALYAFIGIGKTEIIPELIDILNRKGTKTMAEAYLNCGNEELYNATRDWASRHGYIIVPGAGAHPVSWGSWR